MMMRTDLAITSLCCAQCGGMAIQRVSAIWRAGTVDTQSEMIGIYFDSHNQSHSVVSSGYGQSQTHLASLFSPPQMPSRTSVALASGASGKFIWHFLFGVFTAYCDYFLVAYGSSNELSATEKAQKACFALILNGIFLAATVHIVRLRKEVAEEQGREDDARERGRQRYADAHVKWARLYYCSQCDIVFHPQTGDWADAPRIGQFLFAN